MNIDGGSGDVVIGNFTSAIRRLDIEDDVASSTVAFFNNDGNGANRFGITIRAGTDNGTGLTPFVVCEDGDGTELGGLRNNGGVIQVYSTSDERLKKDIAPTQVDGVAVIKALELIQFRYTRQGARGRLHPIGFRAQQAEKVYAPLVSKDQRPWVDRYYTKPTQLIPVLCRAVQQLASRLEALELAP